VLGTSLASAGGDRSMSVIFVPASPKPGKTNVVVAGSFRNQAVLRHEATNLLLEYVRVASGSPIHTSGRFGPSSVATELCTHARAPANQHSQTHRRRRLLERARRKQG